MMKRDAAYSFKSGKFDFVSFFFTGLSGLATMLILGILAVILGNILWHGFGGLSWRFVSTIPEKDFFEPATAAVLPMIIGTSSRVILMTIFVIPVA